MATKHCGLATAFAAVGVLLCGEALAFEFVPTATEFAGWPEHCKARYVTTTAGEGSQFWNRVPRDSIQKWIDRIGYESFNASHHYCAGLIWLDRAKVEVDPKIKAYDLRWAKEETIFTYARLKPDSPLYIEAAVAAARVSLELGEKDVALGYLQKGVELRPNDPAAYIGLANIQLATRNLKGARDALLEADRLTAGRSAEVQYNLGLIMLELGETDGAVERAHAAYGLGYPLQGLKKKLTALGRWTP